MTDASAARGDVDDRVDELLAVYADQAANVAQLLCDRHPADAVAYTLVEPDLSSRQLTYGELRDSSERFAAALHELGVGPGDRVATLLGRRAEHLVAVLGIWRLGAVHVPLFTAFARPAVALRLADSAAKVVVCDDGQRPKLAAGGDMPAQPPWRVIVAGTPSAATDLRLDDLLASHDAGRPATAVGGAAPLVQLYTSGTTGRPKAVSVPVAALASFHAYMEFGLDVRAEDVFWNAADPGWAYGHYYGIAGPLCLGASSIWLHSGFSADLTWAVLERCDVTNFAAAPTVYRALRATGTSPARLRLRCASSAGEPLTQEVNEWAVGALGVPVHDHYGQTETGMLVNNHHNPRLRRPLHRGSMGHAMPGWTVAVLHEDRDTASPAGTTGRIAIDLTASPVSWFSGYLDDPERSAAKFTADGRWYLTGDVGTLDDDGYFSFASRDDDVIIMAGYRIGPFDVESVLLSHAAVVEAAVVAAPDDLRGEVLEAYVVLADGWTGTPELVEELQQHVKTNFAAHAYPRAIHFPTALPKTPSGKLQRFVLREERRKRSQEAATSAQ